MSVLADAGDIPDSRGVPVERTEARQATLEIRRGGPCRQQARGPAARRPRTLGRAGGDRRHPVDHQSELGSPLLRRDARPVCLDRLGPAQGRQDRRPVAARIVSDVLRSGAADLPERRAQSLEHGRLAARDAVQVRQLHLLFHLSGHRDDGLFVAHRGGDGRLDVGAVGARRRLGLPAARNPRRAVGTCQSRRRLRHPAVRGHRPRGDRLRRRGFRRSSSS